MDSAEIAIVGGGVAGLAAAWALRDHDVVVLEASGLIGGRVRSDEHNGASYHLGAQYLSGGATAALLDELGVAQQPLPHADAVFYRGQLFQNDQSSLLDALGLTDAGGVGDLVEFNSECNKAGALMRDVMTPEIDLVAPEREALDIDRRSFAEVLGGRRPEVATLYRLIIRSLACKTPESLSGLYAMSMLGMSGGDGPRRAPGGMAAVLAAFRRELEGRIRLDATVESVTSRDDVVEISYRDGLGARALQARCCVVALPAPSVLKVCPALSERKLTALRRVRYGRFLSVAFFLREPVWKEGWAIVCDLPVVSTVLNPAILTGSGDGTILSSYASADGASRVWNLPDEAVAESYVDEITNVFPQMRDLVDGWHVQRWDPGYPAWEPGHLAVLPTLMEPHGRIAFCGDYLAVPSIEGAIVSAMRAARAVRSELATA